MEGISGNGRCGNVQDRSNISKEEGRGLKYD